MTRQEAEAIVLDVHQARESDRVVVMLLETGESLTAVAPAAARSTRRFGGALQPGTVVRAGWTLRREGAMPILAETQVVQDPPAPDPLETFYATAHVLEITRALASEGCEDPPLFRLLKATLEQFAAGASLEPQARYFEAWALRLAGVLPEADCCSVCGEDLSESAVALGVGFGAVCPVHEVPEARALTRAVSGWLRRSRHVRPGAVPQLPAGSGDALERALISLIEAYTERPLKACAQWAATRVGLRRAEQGS